MRELVIVFYTARGLRAAYLSHSCVYARRTTGFWSRRGDLISRFVKKKKEKKRKKGKSARHLSAMGYPLGDFAQAIFPRNLKKVRVGSAKPRSSDEASNNLSLTAIEPDLRFSNQFLSQTWLDISIRADSIVANI